MVGVDVVEVGDREAVVHDGFDVYFWFVEEGGDVFVLFHFVVFVLLPVLDGGAVPLDYNEVGVEKEDDVVFHFLFVELDAHGFCGFVGEGVGDEGGLDHGNAVVDGLSIDAVTFEEGFVEADSEAVDEVAASKVEDELWELFH